MKFVRLDGHARVFAVEGYHSRCVSGKFGVDICIKETREPKRDLTESSLSSHSFLSSSQRTTFKVEEGIHIHNSRTFRIDVIKFVVS
jgi:hypothetical protein